MPKKNLRNYISIKKFLIDEVLPFVFDRSIRKKLRQEGKTYNSVEWKKYSKKIYRVNGKNITVNMGSHRYQLFALKGLKCTMCGIKGSYFMLERGIKDNPKKGHFNLYAIDNNGTEVMITKDHIIPRSKGGANKLDNYQVMCIKCNQLKGNNYG